MRRYSLPLLLLATAAMGQGAPAEATAAPPSGDVFLLELENMESQLRTLDDFVASKQRLELPGLGELRFSLNLFGDLSGLARSEPGDGGRFAFAIGQIGLLASASLGASMKALVEIVFETNEANVAMLDIERLELSWSQSWFQITAGRVHSPIGYWNTAFHHASWLQLTADRPRMFAFEDEGGALPVHAVGIFPEIRTALGRGTFHLIGTIANGRGDTTDDLRVINDTNNDKSFGVSAYQDGFLVPELRVGLGVLYDRIAAAAPSVRPALPDSPLNEFIGSFHAIYSGKRLTLALEGFGLLHAAPGQQWWTTGGYLLAGYRFDHWTPYVRGELGLPFGGADAFFTPDPSAPAGPSLKFFEMTAGLRFAPTTWTAVKLEYRVTFPLEPLNATHAVVLNWGFGL